MNNYSEKRKALPGTLQDFLTSDVPRYEVEKVCFMYGLEENFVAFLSSPIALIFIDEIKLKDYPAIIAKDLKQAEQIIFGISYEINNRIYARFPDFFKDAQGLLEEWSKKKSAPLLSEDEAWKKVLELEPWIMEEEKEKAQERRKEEDTLKKQQAQLEKLPISIAIEKYAALGEQLITSAHIKLKIFPEPVRPSIKNWLSDYTFTVGISNHDPIVRGNYLFKNENTRTLSETDREKLTTIIDSLENNIPLTVNTGTKQIIFSLPEKKAITQPQAPKRPPFRPNFRNNELEPAEIRRGQENYYPTQKASQPQQKFQSDEDRISAWRRDLPQKEILENKNIPENEIENTTSNIHFSSPQTLSTEKPPEIPQTIQPIQKNYPSRLPVARINYSAPRQVPKNVLDLREE
jgi:flavodoxin